MIIAKLIGGLGNQMFQYAFGYRLAQLSGTELKLDIASFQRYKLHKVAIHHLNVNYENLVIPRNKVNRLTNEYGLRFLLKKVRLVSPKVTIVGESTPGFTKELIRKYDGDVYLDGFWQSEKYFKGSENEIRNHLMVITEPSAANQQMLYAIKNSDAVSVHIRRADYVTNAHTLSYHGICSMQYYQQAAELIKSKVSNPVFFVFSDDIAWAKENINFNTQQFFADMNNADTNYEDLRLMYSCRHHIVANSSFSWWGAWLNPIREKIVIAPRNWFNQPELDASDIVPESWVRI
jgi:Glycosyl transferase family 11